MIYVEDEQLQEKKYHIMVRTPGFLGRFQAPSIKATWPILQVILE
jgi:hypothetical protein